MQKESYNFKYCSSDTIRESPLPFRIQDYPPDRVIDPTGEEISKFSKKLFSLLGNKDYDLDSIVIQGDENFSEDVIDRIEKLNKKRRFALKTEIYPDYLWLQMPEGSAHECVRLGLGGFIFAVINEGVPRYQITGERPVQFMREGSLSSFKADCAFLSIARHNQCRDNGEVPNIPNLVVEVGSSQTSSSLFKRIGSWFTVSNNLGHVVNMALSVDMTYHRRDGDTTLLAESISTGRLHSMKFSLFVAAESTQQVRPGGGDFTTIDMPEITTVEVTTDDEGALQFVDNPQPLYPESDRRSLNHGRRSLNYVQAPNHNLWFPVEMLDDGDVVDRDLPTILLTGQNMIQIFQLAYDDHEAQVNNLP